MDNGSNSQNVLEELDKKLIIKFKRFKGKNKTFIYGLENILDSQKLDVFLRKIKKKLGCGGVLTEDEDKIKMIEFMGDHRLKIKEIILDDKLIDENKIEMKGA
jgi:translation initiation factor 1 (eIF-1/SUI1)